ncbi:glutamate 5-kinase [Duodenibacillus massiliensis]|jgi:glutamate 5-kinase|uniref:glutamate 5-kinase n=1 Tax=Duodenibacillus massiliensis TaxID=1852381 RepID=UPI000EC15A7A|nr:glutamate 5-kinase [Duodenibacillus massiliensis]MBE5701352.1 glutamate 5-kinase [Sutterella sp.]HAF65979.1 glutamate 5-kinase [Sutterella sp.]
MTESVLKNAHRVVVKVGSALVTNDGRGLDFEAIARWATQIAALQKAGKEVLLVSSGAIAEGVLRLGWKSRPKRLFELQAAAAVGQMGLVQAYETRFAGHGIKTAQILLTHADLADRERYLNARDTLIEILRLGCVPIINENDTVVTDEIKVGDNDTLGALVTNLVEADAFVILTDQKGLYTADPRKDPTAVFVAQAVAGDPALEKMAGGAASTLSKGGMITKILAAKRAARSGAATIIASGREKDVLIRLSQGEAIGTELSPRQAPMHARSQWLADHLRCEGRVILDAGAAAALLKRKTSLLPVGVKAVEGDFVRGDVVACTDEKGVEIARGLANYASSEIRMIKGKHTEEIEGVLGYCAQPEFIHRDNLVMTV